jgi:tetratricopeptide (TPR) repeat protein
VDRFAFPFSQTMNSPFRFLFSGAVFALAGLARVSAADSEVASIIKKGDALEAKIATQAALDTYLAGEKAAPQNAELLRRIAREYSELMADTESNGKKRELGEKALGYAKRAVDAEPQNAKAQLAAAICYGRLALLLDNKTKIAYSKLVKEHADKSRALDPNDDLTYHVLGAWNYELAILNPFMRGLAKLIYGDIPHASLEDAAEDFRHAIKLNPQRLANHVELGRTYAAMGKKTEAREELQRGLAMPNRQKDDPGTKQRATEALQKL